MHLKKSWLICILSFIGTLAMIALGIVIIPGITDFGETILKIVLAIGVFAYIGFFLIKKLVKERGMVLVLTIVETIVMFLVGLGLILSQFNVLNITEACIIIGVAIWMRGVIGVFSGYIRRNTPESRKKYDILFFFLNIVLITLGTWMFVKPFISNFDMIIVLAVVCFLIAIGLLTIGLLTCPAIKKGRAKKTSKKKTEKKEVKKESK